jgi:hypothetical protein
MSTRRGVSVKVTLSREEAGRLKKLAEALRRSKADTIRVVLEEAWRKILAA